jgi:hypothetical protein
MRKIESKQEIEARRKKIQLVVVISMVGLLLLATVGYFASEMFGGSEESSTRKISYAGRTYIRQNDILLLEENGKVFQFFDLPNESRGIYLNSSSFSDFAGKPLYLTKVVPEAQVILSNLHGIYLRTNIACLELEDCKENEPLKNCSDNVIAFIESEETKVERKENCIFIYGDLKKGVDAFSYSLLGIK